MQPNIASRIMKKLAYAIVDEIRCIERNTYDIQQSKESIDSNLNDIAKLKEVLTLLKEDSLYDAMDILSFHNLNWDTI